MVQQISPQEYFNRQNQSPVDTKDIIIPPDANNPFYIIKQDDPYIKWILIIFAIIILAYIAKKLFKDD